MKYYLIALIATTVLLAGCVMGPNYQRPKIESPAAFRGDDSKPTKHLLPTRAGPSSSKIPSSPI